MKLHFEPDLDYQLQTIEAVCDLFPGQEICRTGFTVTRDPADTQLRLEPHAFYGDWNYTIRSRHRKHRVSYSVTIPQALLRLAKY